MWLFMVFVGTALLKRNFEISHQFKVNDVDCYSSGDQVSFLKS